MKEILGKAKTVRELLGGAKYSIDYYQREYRWQQKQMAELVDDLTGKFLESFDPADERAEVENYGHYFLGSIIISDRDGQKFIIDGQQRLTSLTLLLIYLHRHLADEEEKKQLADLIFSQKFGKRSFNLNVPDRTPCMEALYTGQTFDPTDQSESVVNILARYGDIEELFPDEGHDPALAYFADWLIENVHLVEITAYSDADAYTIFETMNDRGLSLTPTDMLKGYLLANITDVEGRNRATKVWRDRLAECQKWGREEDADAIKAWLRSQHANKIRERKRDAKPEDFDLIGTEFHRWVRDQEERLGLANSADFIRFIERDFKFYTGQYLRIRQAGAEPVIGLEPIYFNAQHKFTLQYPVLLAALLPDDPEAEILRKLRLISSFIDILVTRRVWNWRSIDYSTLQYAMFTVIRDVRGKSAADAAQVLTQRLADDQETFAKNERFALHGTNGRVIHRLLARMTDYVETRSGQASRFVEYTASGRNATRSNIYGRTIPSVTPMKSPTPAILRPCATESVASCCCRRVSMPATATCPTRKNCRITSARISWRVPSTRSAMRTIRVSFASSRKLPCRSRRTVNSDHPTWSNGATCTSAWLSTSGIPIASWRLSRHD